jgi:hypothetical protein
MLSSNDSTTAFGLRSANSLANIMLSLRGFDSCVSLGYVGLPSRTLKVGIRFAGVID